MKTSFAPPNILVVDDVTENLSILTEIIHRKGFIVRPVTSARQAVSAIETLVPDLILLDISMPDIDGYVLCSMLKKSVKTREIPVILISVLNSSQERIKGYQAGAVDFIIKPFEEEELILRINTHLKMYKTRQELEVYNKKMNKIINDQIHKIYEEQKTLLYGMTRLASRRYGYAPNHMNNVGKNCRILALGLQLSQSFREQITNSFIDAIELAAPLHDIGKVSIGDHILLNTKGLSFEEKEQLKQHTSVGAEILEEMYSLNSNNDLLKMAIDIVKYHHEYWDGTGYPLGLKGNAIPLSARIVAIVHTYDSYINRTSSPTSGSHEKSIDRINDAAGSLFDPEIVSVLNKIQNQLIK